MSFVHFSSVCTPELFNHGLLGGTSPVLTSTGFVNGREQFLTLQRIHTILTDHQKMLQVIRSATPAAVANLVQIRQWGASGQMGEI